jgi:hypothetical protein
MMTRWGNCRDDIEDQRAGMAIAITDNVGQNHTICLIDTTLTDGHSTVRGCV